MSRLSASKAFNSWLGFMEEGAERRDGVARWMRACKHRFALDCIKAWQGWAHESRAQANWCKLEGISLTSRLSSLAEVFALWDLFIQWLEAELKKRCVEQLFSSAYLQYVHMWSTWLEMDAVARIRAETLASVTILVRVSDRWLISTEASALSAWSALDEFWAADTGSRRRVNVMKVSGFVKQCFKKAVCEAFDHMVDYADEAACRDSCSKLFGLGLSSARQNKASYLMYVLRAYPYSLPLSQTDPFSASTSASRVIHL
jgi:hypothetical protein